MPVTVVLGAQWGDEGKGRIVDLLAQKADVCVRFNGGDNAGHTIINDRGEFKLHLVPAGIFNPNILCVIGNGVAVNPKILFEEIANLRQRGISCQNLKVSARAHLIMPWHVILDGLQEKERGSGKIGTTQRGIGPVFADKIARYGFRAGDFFIADFEERLRQLWEKANSILAQVYGYSGPDMDYKTILKDLLHYRAWFSALVEETEEVIWKALDNNKRILMEGAQGTLLDPDFGTYPRTTSSSCILAGALQGSGVSWRDIKEVIGVVKAYSTRVCDSSEPFFTEMDGKIADSLREQAHEYGTTTGRARRMGWLDATRLRYAAKINGFTGLAITRMDNLGTLPGVKICHAYGENNEPHYLGMAGSWGSNMNNKNARRYLKTIEKFAGVPIKYISYGPERNQIIVKK